jgi:hypothetical protein
MVRNFMGLVATLLAVAACQRAGDRTSTQPADRAIDAAEAFIDAFYSFERGRLEPILAAARESAPEILYYQGWAEGGNYEIVSRAPCKRIRPETVSCSITVKDDLIGALGIDFNVTDTFTLTLLGDTITAVETSSDDPPEYELAEQWVRRQRPELIAEPCQGFFDGGPTPGACVRAMVKGYAEYAVSAVPVDPAGSSAGS